MTLLRSIPDRSLQKTILFLVFLIGAASIWLPSRPPMIDLPQFAGQIALLDGLLKGTSPWAGELRIDALTPYLVAYAVTVPLAFFLPIGVALKLVLTLALAGFGWAAAAIRRELGAAPQLDAYAFVGFFGYAYAWGLVTFLVAAPLGLLLIWMSLRYARNADQRGGVALLAAGLVLLFAHGLIFLFACGLGLVLTAARSQTFMAALRRCWPFALLFGAGLGLYLLARAAAGSGGGGGGGAGFGLNFGDPLVRLLAPLGAIDGRPEPWTIIALIVLIALPFVAGLRVDFRSRERIIIAFAALGAVAFAPDGAWVAAGVFRRFALFAPAAYAWLFSDASAASDRPKTFLSAHLGALASAIVALILTQHVVEAAEFNREAPDFDAIMARAQPGMKALSIVIDRASSADVDLHVYLHFPSWYQAEKNGLVDPSFAASAPSIVRYRTNTVGVSDDIFQDGGSHAAWWRAHRGQWTYFFVRGARTDPRILFAGADCTPQWIGGRGAWALYQARPCGGGRP